MPLTACRPLPLTLLALLLASAPPWLRAQASPAPASAAGIYTCVDDQGRKLTSDRPIAELHRQASSACSTRTAR